MLQCWDYIIKIVINSEKANFVRLREEGYVTSEKTISYTSQSEPLNAPFIETVTLKELSKKTATDYLKVSLAIFDML